MKADQIQYQKGLPKKGFFVTFEGIDGSGKTTLSKAVLEECLRRSMPAIRTFEPGDSDLGAELRPILLSDKIDSRTSALLFAADRAHHVDSVIKPAMNEDQLILCDRFETSSVVYQGIWRELGAERIREISRFASAALLPDIIVWSKIRPDVAADRRGAHPDAMDQAATKDAIIIAKAFEDEAAKDPSRFFIVDAHLPVSELVEQVADHIQKQWEIRAEFAKKREENNDQALSKNAKGRLILISGPSGAGKNTVLDGLIEGNGNSRWYSVSVTTRRQREKEKAGSDYHFIDDREFDKLLNEKRLLEHASFASARYGTPSAPIDERLNSGVDVFALVELSGVRQIKSERPDALVIFLIPPSMKALEQRLRSRATESESQILTRLQTAQIEMEEGPQLADYVICNNDVNTVVKRIEHILRR